jgi:hydroxymethylpyrimidine pyrophosphatase-like HAD family hydrolase
MRYSALACDYDGTLARHGMVDPAVTTALERVRQTGRRLILVTGRQLSDLQDAYNGIHLFDRVVAENGAVLYDPLTREQQLLGDPPSQPLIDELRRLHVEPLSIGQSIIATWEPQQAIVLDAIRRLGLELHVIFNKGAVMVLPSGHNKASGLAVALDALQLSQHNVVGIGDAENDHAFLSMCECAVATANAVETLKQRADVVTRQDHGAGVIELADHLVASDLAGLDPFLSRHDVTIGTARSGDPAKLRAAERRILVAGPSGTGKSTLVTAFLESLMEAKYQICVIDPEGDYEKFPDVVLAGDAEREPSANDVLNLLAAPSRSVVVNLLAVPVDHRPVFLASLLPGLLQLRQKTGRPHWIVVDEAHHMLPPDFRSEPATLAAGLTGLLLITVHPDQIWPPALENLDIVLVTGSDAGDTLAAVPNRGIVAAVRHHPLEQGEALMWSQLDGDPVTFRPNAPHSERLRHRRKYATGQLGPDRSFFFTGPKGALNLRAQNLMLFMQIADGVDDETWLHHLRQGDYSRWFRDAIKDDGLAQDAAVIERMRDLSATETRDRIRAAIEQRYTKPASVERT